MSDTAIPHELALPGLREDNPRDFLAALGLMRIVELLWPESEPKLYWAKDSGMPHLTLAKCLPDDWGSIMLNTFLEWKASDQNPFGFGKIKFIDPHEFRIHLIDGFKHSDFRVRYLASLCSQISRPGFSRRSEFIIESAGRSVLNGVSALLENRRNPIDIQGDFQGSGTLREVSNTSRWHPAELKSAAYSSADPEDINHRDFASLNVFALLGLSFFPVLDTQGGRRTVGFRRTGKLAEFSWPVWDTPLDPSSMASLLHHPGIHQPDFSIERLKGLGIYQVWRSRKFKANGDNEYFSLAQPSF